MWDWMPWMMWGFMLLVWLLVIAAIVGGIILVVRASRSDGAERPAGHRGSGALDILEQRYARGEIDTQEFEERRRALGE